MRVLVVEDDIKIASFVVKGLEQAGFAVDHSDNGEEGLFLAQTEPYDAAIIDVMLPGLDGLSLIAEMRKAQVHTPVIILSAKRSVGDRIKGLQTGSDDYLVKPFVFAELLARLQALIRRSTGPPKPPAWRSAISPWIFSSVRSCGADRRSSCSRASSACSNISCVMRTGSCPRP